MNKPVLEIRNGMTRHPAKRMAEPVNLRILPGEQVAIVGDNAAGKSRLVDIITSRYPLLGDEVHYDFSPREDKLLSNNLHYITFRDSYGESDGTYYLQQRWNQHDIDEKTPTAGVLLDRAFQCLDHKDETLRQRLYDMFHLEPLLDKYIITLSSGELRKFQLTKALLSNPRVLIMDNPFIGLDAATRDLLRDLLKKLTEETDLMLVLVISKTDELPDVITHVIPVEGLHVMPKKTRAEYVRPTPPQHALPDGLKEWILRLPQKDIATMPFYPKEGGEILRFTDVCIRYGKRTILKDLNWTVHEGGRWALSGENGAGKSTLLSLVCADNPQAYACNIRLFGRQRGTGESIWEIKHHIGYVSPESHRAYLRDLPAIDIVASGLNDTVGLYCRPKPEQRQTCLDWMRVFGVDHLADRTFLQLSSGEQRLCLLARAFLKDPELLILDEPLHGLDLQNRARVRDVIETFCLRQHKTLVMVTHYEEELPPCITEHLRLKKNV